jgi:hypothetical protein
MVGFWNNDIVLIRIRKLARILKPIFMKRTFILLLFSACISFSLSAQVTILPYGLDITNDDVSQLSIDYQSTAGTHDWWLNFYGHLLMRNNEFGNFAADEYWHFGARNTGNLDIAFGTASGTNVVNAANAILTLTQDERVGILNNNPASPLDVEGPVTIRRSSGALVTGVNFRDENDDLVGRMALTSGGGMNLDAFEGGDITFGGVGINSGTMRFTNDGDLGVGAAAPSAKVEINHNSSGSDAHLELFESETSGDFARLKFRSNFPTGDPVANQKRVFLINANPADTGDPNLHIAFDEDDTANPLAAILFTVEGEDQQVGIRQNDPEADFHIRQSNGNNASTGIRLEDNDGTYWNVWTDNGNDLLFHNDGSNLSQIENGTGNYQLISDNRLKTEIAPLRNVLGKVKDLRPIWYHINSDPNQKKTLGFMAQEVESVLPDFVDSQKEYKTLTYDYFGVLAIKAIQEQQEIIEEKEDRIRDLEQRLADLEETLERVVQHVELPAETESPVVLTDARLGQNEPNPSLGTTRIPFTIPTSARSATLRVTASNGQLIKEIAIDQRGQGQLTLQTGQLSPAAYQYTLWIDGQAVATKQMLIQK